MHILPQMLLDVVCVYVAYFVAMILRLSDVNVSTIERLVYMEAYGRIMPVFALLCLAVFVLFKFYRTIWEFAGTSELMQIVAGVTLACGLSTGVSWAILQQIAPGCCQNIYIAGSQQGNISYYDLTADGKPTRQCTGADRPFLFF